MKKIIIAAAVCCAASVAQAAPSAGCQMTGPSQITLKVINVTGGKIKGLVIGRMTSPDGHTTWFTPQQDTSFVWQNKGVYDANNCPQGNVKTTGFGWAAAKAGDGTVNVLHISPMKMASASNVTLTMAVKSCPNKISKAPMYLIDQTQSTLATGVSIKQISGDPVPNCPAS